MFISTNQFSDNKLYALSMYGFFILDISSWKKIRIILILHIYMVNAQTWSLLVEIKRYIWNKKYNAKNGMLKHWWDTFNLH